jgi:hypothetical protein
MLLLASFKVVRIICQHLDFYMQIFGMRLLNLRGVSVTIAQHQHYVLSFFEEIDVDFRPKKCSRKCHIILT